MKIFLNFLLFVCLLSCSKEASSPEDLLKQFVNDMTSKKLDKEYFEKHTTGKMLEKVADFEAELKKINESIPKEERDEKELKVENVSPLTFVKKPKLEILRKNCQDNRCSLTFIIKFTQKMHEADKENSADYTTEVKKLAVVVKEDEHWKLADITNIKTFLETNKPIGVEAEI